MAYPTVSASYGFRPVNLLGGQVFAGSTRQMAIASGHATNIFFGDVVIMSANGCINNATATATTQQSMKEDLIHFLKDLGSSSSSSSQGLYNSNTSTFNVLDSNISSFSFAK